MILEEWIRLTDESRDQLTKHWYQIGEPRRLGIIADEAIKRLRAEIGSFPEVNCVWMGEWPQQGVYLVVSTCLEENQTLSSIPETFATFKVVQAGTAGAKRRFLECWQVLFSKICGWSEDKARGEMQYLDSSLNEHGGVAYYRGAPYHAAEVLVHEVAPDLKGLPLVHLQRAVHVALEYVDGVSYRFPNEHTGYDWSAARRRVMAAFEQFGIAWQG